MKEAQVPWFVRRNARDGLGFSDLCRQALEELAALEGRAEIVCGPITSGGENHTTKNLLIFNYAIEVLEGFLRRPMWSQIPYEAGLARLECEWKSRNPTASYCHPILTEFYEPLFRSDLIRRAWFIGSWATSVGATWEHKMLSELGCDIVVLPPGWLEDYRTLSNVRIG